MTFIILPWFCFSYRDSYGPQNMNWISRYVYKIWIECLRNFDLVDVFPSLTLFVSCALLEKYGLFVFQDILASLSFLCQYCQSTLFVFLCKLVQRRLSYFVILPVSLTFTYEINVLTGRADHYCFPKTFSHKSAVIIPQIFS